MSEVTLYGFKAAQSILEGKRIDGVNPVPIGAIQDQDNTWRLKVDSVSSFGDSANVDGFARLRVGNPFTVFDSKQVWNDPDLAANVEHFPLFFDNQEVSGGGTATLFDIDRASTILSVSASTAGKRVRQTRQRFNYQPGKSQLVILTGKAGLTSSGNTKQLGLFDDNNGIFYRDTGGAWSVVIRSNVSGSPIDTVVGQLDWNLDTMDGNGPSGVLLNPEAVQILFFDFEWLGVGRVRFGFVIDGVPIYVHDVMHVNVISSVYMSTPNLPVRFTIENDGSGGADSVEQICGTVISEGGVQIGGTLRFADIGATGANDISAGTAGTTYAICGIKLKANYLSASVDPAILSIIENSGANNPFLWKLHFNPTLDTGLTYSDQPNSAISFGVGLAAGDEITDPGTVIAGGYQSRTDATASVPLDLALKLGSLIDGTSDEFVLSGTPLTNNQLFFGGMQWAELW